MRHQLVCIVVTTLLVACPGCRDDTHHGKGETIGRAELDRILKAEGSASSLKSKANDHFKSEGYSFEVLFSGGPKDSPAEVVGREPDTMICRGVKNENEALDVDKALSEFLGADELSGIKRLYDLPGLGFSSGERILVPAELLSDRAAIRSEIRERQQALAPTPSLSPSQDSAPSAHGAGD
jgi:hypothetical protein